MTRIFGLGKTSAAALAIACFCACARQGAADGDLFRVAAVNCGAFLYGADRATPEEFASEWKRFAHEGKYDIIFYSDVGKGSPGNCSVEGFDIRAASARRPVSVLSSK